MSCQASAKRLSRNTVLCLNKLNENKDFEEVSSHLYSRMLLLVATSLYLTIRRGPNLGYIYCLQEHGAPRFLGRYEVEN